MAIILAETEVAETRLTGTDTFDVAAGTALKIETSPQGVEILNETVPTGKVWRCVVCVYIVEQDV